MVSVVFRTVRSGFRHSNGFLCARRLIRGATPKKEDHAMINKAEIMQTYAMKATPVPPKYRSLC